MKYFKLCLAHYRPEIIPKRWLCKIKYVAVRELEAKSRKGKSIEIPGPSHGGAQPCNGLRCKTYVYIEPCHNFISYITNQEYPIISKLDCSSSNIIYM